MDQISPRWWLVPVALVLLLAEIAHRTYTLALERQEIRVQAQRSGQ